MFKIKQILWPSLSLPCRHSISLLWYRVAKCYLRSKFQSCTCRPVPHSTHNIFFQTPNLQWCDCNTTECYLANRISCHIDTDGIRIHRICHLLSLPRPTYIFSRPQKINFIKLSHFKKKKSKSKPATSSDMRTQ